MADNYVGEIRMFAAVRNAAPNGWFFCDGSLQSISTYQVLYSLLGTVYGGDGVTTFGLPDFRSRLPLGMGQEGTFNYALAAKGGLEQVNLTSGNMPAHTHNWVSSTQTATVTTATGNMYANVPVNGTAGGLYEDINGTGFAWKPIDPTVIASAGTPNATHENRMPGMAISFIIAWSGLYPVRGN